MKNLTTFGVAVMLGLALLSSCGGDETAGEAEAGATAVPTTPPAPMPDPTATAEPTPTPEPSPTSTPEPTPVPTATPEPTATAQPTATPDSAATPTTEDETASDPTPTAQPTIDAEPAVEQSDTTDAGVAGQTIFATRCAVCHGPGGNGSNQGPPLTGIGQFFPDDASPLIGLVTNGGTNMPEFGSKLTADEIEAVVQYVVATFR